LPGKASRTALVVDDSMLVRHSVCRFLEERGYTVEAATNGLDALELLKRIHPDIIITDMQMPKMSGGELIKALKAEPSTAQIPVVIVTSRHGALDECEKRAAFAIRKDIDIEVQLAKALGEVFNGPRAQAASK
jgi:CheY-like chemotaxis protein